MNNIAPLFETFFIICGAGAIDAFVIPARCNATLLGTIGSLGAALILTASALLLVGNASFRVELWSVSWHAPF
jgi:hypothetical protein